MNLGQNKSLDLVGANNAPPGWLPGMALVAYMSNSLIGFVLLGLGCTAVTGYKGMIEALQ